MAEGRQRSEWNQTAQVLAMLYNIFRGRGQRALSAADFHPFAKPSTPTTTLKQLSDLGILKPSKD